MLRRANVEISILREGAAGLVNKRKFGRHVVIFKTCDDQLDLCEELSAGITNLQDTVDSVELDKEIEKSRNWKSVNRGAIFPPPSSRILWRSNDKGIIQYLIYRLRKYKLIAAFHHWSLRYIAQRGSCYEGTEMQRTSDNVLMTEFIAYNQLYHLKTVLNVPSELPQRRKRNPFV